MLTRYTCLQMLSLQFPTYPPGTHWVPTPYVVPAPTPMQPVDDGYNLPAHMSAAPATYKNDGQPPRGISVMLPSPEATAMPYNQMIPQVSINGTYMLNDSC